MTRKPPIKCAPTRATINGTRYKIHSNGDISESLRLDQMEAAGVKTLGDLVNYESKSSRWFADSDYAKIIRKEVQRLRRNKLTRERNQTMRDLGLKKTAYGWE